MAPALEVADIFRAKRFDRRIPVVSGASSDGSWAPSRRAGRRSSAAMSSNATIAVQPASLTTRAATVTVPNARDWRAQWLADRQAELLPVPYFHVVFTLPAPVGEIAFQNKSVVYAILSSQATAVRTNKSPSLAVAKPVPTSSISQPCHYPHSARPPAASFDPASERSHS